MSRGVTMKTPERVAQAAALREQGLKWREIGEALGVSLSTAQTWVADPDGAVHAARKESYRGACIDCGAPTDGSCGPGKASPRCCACANVHNGAERKIWTRAAILLAIEEWAAVHGHPPTQCHWGAASNGKHSPHRDDFLREYAQGAIPWFTTVVREFGCWADAIEAAGFPRPLVGKRQNGARP